MNNRYLKFLRTLLQLGLAAFVLTFFTGCENFMRGSNVKQELEELIAYENALTHQLIIRSDPAMGSFLSEGEKPCKLGFTIDLQFTMNKDDYVFHGFEAVCVNDPTQSRADCVEFTINKTESDPDKGIYKVTVKLVKAADDILIRPVCVLIPAVESYSPDASSLNYLNTPIRIHFNMPMDPLVVLEKDEQGNYANISIEYLGEDMSGMFEAPYFDSSNTNMFLTPKGGELKEYLKDTNSAYYNFDISLKQFFVMQTVDGTDYNLTLKGNSDSGYDFIIKYRYAIEETNPIQYIFKATRHEISIDTISNLSKEDEFLYGDIDLSMSTDNVDIRPAVKQQLHNRAGEIIYLYGVFYDSESGVRAVRVKEHLMKDPFYAEDTNVNGEDDKTTYYYISDNNDDVNWVDKGDGYVTFCIKHNIKSQTGAVNITVDVLDGAGNATAEKDAYDNAINNEFIVTKRDYKNFFNPEKFYFTLYNGGLYNNYGYDYLINKYYDNETAFDSTEYNKYLKKLYLMTTSDEYGLCALYGWAKIPVDKITIQCKYINSSKKEVTEDFEFAELADEDNYFWELDLDVDTLEGKDLTLIIADDMGNREEVEYKIPKADTISYTIDGNNVSFFSSSGIPIGSVLQVRNGAYAKYQSFTFSDSIEILQNNTYTICPKFNFDYGYLYIEMPNFEFSTNSSSEELNDKITNCQIYISESPRDGSRVLDVTVTVDEDIWNRFDAVYADFTPLYDIPEYDNEGKRKQFIKGNNSITVKYKDKKLYEGEITCTVYGVKNNRVSEGKEETFGPVSGIQYDNTPPELSPENLTYSYAHPYVEFSLIDEQSGPDHGIITINGISHYFTDSIKIYDWDICLNPDSELSIVAEFYDKAGNKGKLSSRSGIQFFPVTSIEKQNDTEWYAYITSETLSGTSYISQGKIVYYYLNDDGTWSVPTEYSLHSHVTDEGETDGLYTWRVNDVPLPQNKFVKILNAYNQVYSSSSYFYTGTTADLNNPGVYNMLLPYSSSTSKVIVSSDGPVFVHTAVTDRGYDVCKNWDVKEWEFYKKSIGNKYLNFTSAPGTQQKYDIPMREITSGQCYVVIAHYANGNVEMSEVMQKP